MYDEELLERLRAYVRENRGTYTTEAIRARLIKDGAPEDAVDRVLAETGPYAPPDAAAASPAPASGTVWLFIGVGAASVVANLVVIVTTVIAGVATESQVVVVLVLVGGIALEIAGAAAIGKASGKLSTKLLVALALTPLAVFLTLAGVCAAMIAAS